MSRYILIWACDKASPESLKLRPWFGSFEKRPHSWACVEGRELTGLHVLSQVYNVHFVTNSNFRFAKHFHLVAATRSNTQPSLINSLNHNDVLSFLFYFNWPYRTDRKTRAAAFENCVKNVSRFITSSSHCWKQSIDNALHWTVLLQKHASKCVARKGTSNHTTFYRQRLWFRKWKGTFWGWGFLFPCAGCNCRTMWMWQEYRYKNWLSVVLNVCNNMHTWLVLTIVIWPLVFFF